MYYNLFIEYMFTGFRNYVHILLRKTVNVKDINYEIQ